MKKTYKIKHISCICRDVPSSLLRFRSVFSVSIIVFQLIVGLLVFQGADPVHAAPGASDEMTEYLSMPWEYGEVIYRINPQSSKQLYIIGISHRNAASGATGSTTVKAQQEIYRIGEWLKNSAQLDLLLPEGYFNETLCTGERKRPVSSADILTEDVVGNDQLEQELEAETFTNAEMLLMKHLSFHACQVENKAIYSAVRSSLSKLYGTGSQRSDYRQATDEIQYLQEVRTVQLLQDIPGIIEDQFDYGVIGNRSAIFTIGLNHIKDIFRYIENGSIDVVPTLQPGGETSLQQSALNLLKTGYGISIILPRSLADNNQLLERTKIDRILLADGKT